MIGQEISCHRSSNQMHSLTWGKGAWSFRWFSRSWSCLLVFFFFCQHERQMAKEETVTLTDKLDQDWKNMRNLISLKVKLSLKPCCFYYFSKTVVNRITFNILECGSEIRLTRKQLRISILFCVLSTMPLRRILLCWNRHKKHNKVSDDCFAVHKQPFSWLFYLYCRHQTLKRLFPK